MNIQILGLNHKTAPIEIREKVSFSDRNLDRALFELSKYDAIQENVILSTCNRTEIYTVVKDIPKATESIKDFLSSFHKVHKEHIDKHLYYFCDKEAIRHLFRVTASLDSMIVGETQIFGQVKDAFFKAKEANTLGRNLYELFDEAIRIGKRIRTETQIGKGAVSVSTAALELARKIFESLDEKKVMIIGAGKIGELTVKNLHSRGISTVLVANRTFEKAEELAKVFCGKAIKFEECLEHLVSTDIVISSTSAPHFIITKGEISLVMNKRGNSPLFLIDLGLPRNIDPGVDEIENAYLYNIDDLARVRDANIKERLNEAKKAEAIIQSCVDSVIRKLNLEQRHSSLVKT
jgi:glutamyl-tRNA reductase